MLTKLAKKSLQPLQACLVPHLLNYLIGSLGQFVVSNHKLFTPSTTNLSNIVHGNNHVAVYLRSLLYYQVPYQRKTLFMHGKVSLYHILICCIYHHRNWVWPLLCHILFFLITFPRQGLEQNSVFANRFHLWYLSYLNIYDGFVNVTGRVIIPLLFGGSGGNHVEKWLVTWCARYWTWFLLSCFQYAINCCFNLDDQ